MMAAGSSFQQTSQGDTLVGRSLMLGHGARGLGTRLPVAGPSDKPSRYLHGRSLMLGHSSRAREHVRRGADTLDEARGYHVRRTCPESISQLSG